MTTLLIEGVAMALDTLRANKLRSGLTILGIVIGISSIVGMTAMIPRIRRIAARGRPTDRTQHHHRSAGRPTELCHRGGVCRGDEAAQPHGLRRPRHRTTGAVDSPRRHSAGHSRVRSSGRGARVLSRAPLETTPRSGHDRELRDGFDAGVDGGPILHGNRSAVPQERDRPRPDSQSGRAAALPPTPIRSARWSAWAASALRSWACSRAVHLSEASTPDRTISWSSRTRPTSGSSG